MYDTRIFSQYLIEYKSMPAKRLHCPQQSYRKKSLISSGRISIEKYFDSQHNRDLSTLLPTSTILYSIKPTGLYYKLERIIVVEGPKNEC